MTRILFPLFIVLSTVSASFAQDAHYWTLQFGSKSALLGGAVIGSVEDISATYYNPGALSLIDDLSFTISADVLEFSRLSMSDGGGRGIDLNNSNTGIRPSLVAGTIRENVFESGGVLAYSLLNRQSGHFDIQGLILLDKAAENPELAFDDLALLARFEGVYNDTWAGLTYAQPISDKFALGVTWYNTLRSQRRWTEFSLQGVDEDPGTGTISVLAATSNFYSYSMIFKLGASLKMDQLTAGLTVTTPSMHMFGKGHLGHDESYVSPDSSALAVNYQSKLSAKYKSPVSIGLGASYNLKRFTIHISTEWFDALAPYVVMQGQDWEAQKPGDVTNTLESIHEQKSIINWSVGLQYAVRPKLNLYGSYYIDNTTRDDAIVRADLSTSSFNINNVSLGTNFHIGGVRFDLGLGYSWGENLNERLSDIFSGTDEDIEVSFIYKSIKVLFGIEVDLYGKERGK